MPNVVLLIPFASLKSLFIINKEGYRKATLGQVIHLVQSSVSGNGIRDILEWRLVGSIFLVVYHSLADKYTIACGCTNICRYINHYTIFDVSLRMY